MLKYGEEDEIKKQVCLGDRILFTIHGQVREGIVTSITERGVGIKNDKGSDFYKWCHVRKVESKLLDKIKRYEEALQFYADDDHYDMRSIWDSYGEFRGSLVDYDRGEKALSALKGR